MFAASPVRDEQGVIVAVLALRIRPETDFTRILSVARSGESGETYAFDSEGILLSESRFDNELKQIGLIPDRKDARSILSIQIRDPLVDMTQGQRPTVPRDEQPLTRMAASAIATIHPAEPASFACGTSTSTSVAPCRRNRSIASRTAASTSPSAPSKK